VDDIGTAQGGGGGIKISSKKTRLVWGEGYSINRECNCNQPKENKTPFWGQPVSHDKKEVINYDHDGPP